MNCKKLKRRKICGQKVDEFFIPCLPINWREGLFHDSITPFWFVLFGVGDYILIYHLAVNLSRAPLLFELMIKPYNSTKIIQIHKIEFYAGTGYPKQKRLMASKA